MIIKMYKNRPFGDLTSFTYIQAVLRYTLKQIQLTVTYS